LAQRNSLGGTSRANLRVSLLDIAFAFADQPVTEVAINFRNSELQLFGWNLPIIGQKRRGAHPFQEARSQRVGMSFDEPDKPVGKHHDRLLVAPLKFSVGWQDRKGRD
jgi:hypothetical protein